MIVSQKWGEIEGEREVDELEECIQKRKRLATELQEQLARLQGKKQEALMGIECFLVWIPRLLALVGYIRPALAAARTAGWRSWSTYTICSRLFFRRVCFMLEFCADSFENMHAS